ncbi:MAG: endonuclease MutS2 [Clostridia bacterium]|jgi:DNA mismatch repair protein MutS2|uniref:endonuclease MutS2 n=1 Tax=Petroclostridium xylanilyticum TaxID=1792311 RepID=UPI000B98EB39|nr:endonuclease MutS2 [Petroclostridium xylanilyticum]MBZ4644836.1 endonuclease MutS2 [Clostridia bacterium]
MNQKVLKVLEYNKILDKLAGFTTSVLSKEIALNLCPVTDIHQVIHLQKETSEAVSMVIRKGSPPIDGLSDIRGSLKRAEIGAVLSPKELLEIAHSLRISRNMKRYAGEDRREQVYPILDALIEELQIYKKVEDAITTSIISEDEISDNASPELSNIRRHIRNVNNKVKDILNDIIHSPRYQKYLQEPIITVRGDRYVVPVKSEHKGDIAGLVHDSSASGATLFIEPIAVVEANNELRQLKIKEKNEIERILSELTYMIKECAEGIKNNVKIITALDFIFAKAKLSLEWNAVEPKINDQRYIDIKKARHPLLDQKAVVATDIYLGKDFNTLVITGPNTGGKTVTLKTIGLFTLMAQSGLHVPASDGTELAVFKKVFADIGDEQSIEQSLSTFSSHMTNIVKILQEVDDESLVLFDELGAGTDPVEGAALAMSILEYLYQIGARTAATTHYSELKLFALSTKGVENAACEFDVDTLRPTYRLLIGVPGKSNAFAISSRLGLDQNIIERAKEFISQEDVKFEDIISNLEKNRQMAEREKEKAILYKQEAEALKDELIRQKEKLHAQKEKMLEEARREARKIIQQAKIDAEEIIREIRKIQEETEEKERNKAIEQARMKLRSKLDQIDDSLAQSILPKNKYSSPPKNLKPGDSVLITTLNQKGNIISIPDENGEAQVQVGIMKINVHVSNLRLIEDSKDQMVSSTGAGKISIAKSAHISTELDLRGQTLDEALLNTDKYLDDAALAGLQQVTIIHGKGTGALRNGIHNMLKTHSHVKSFRLGKYGEGETGVTIVELK